MDLNGDGHNDILSGSYSRMTREMAGLFQVLWGDSSGGFKKAEVLKGLDGEPLIIPIASKREQTENICTRPTAVDWDADGDLDLVVGNFAGTFYVFEGKGKGTFFAKPKPIKVDGAPLRIQGAHSDPVVVDWDQDGDLDIVSGASSGGVQWAENKAGAGKPVELSKFKTLIPRGAAPSHNGMLRETDIKGPTQSTRVFVDDVNGDGKLDILVGDSVTLRAPAKGLSMADYKAKQAAWSKEYSASVKKLNKPGLDAKERQKVSMELSKLYQDKSKFVEEQRTGFVWLYVQK